MEEIEINKWFGIKDNIQPDYDKFKIETSHGRKSRKPCFVLLYNHAPSGHQHYENNTGFDCNYFREWKTLNGVKRFIQREYGTPIKQ